MYQNKYWGTDPCCLSQADRRNAKLKTENFVLKASVKFNMGLNVD